MSVQPHSATAPRRFSPPSLQLSNGAVEALKWLALVLMTLDHVNKYLLQDRFVALFAAGRLAMPLFATVFAFNLARSDAMRDGVYRRVAVRLAIAGTVACVPFIALGGLAFHWWPLNILWMLLVSCGVIYAWERGGVLPRAGAVILFLVGGAVVEFWWPAVLLCVAAWRYFKSPSWSAAGVWIASATALFVINRNLWALATLPLLIGAACYGPRSFPRLRKVFYAYYPAHLAAIWLISRLLT